MATKSQRAVYINGTALQPKQAAMIGEGGEAEVYELDPDTVLKLYKLPDHPSFAGTTVNACLMQQAAKNRLDIIQQKLPSFPALPHGAVAPLSLAYGGTAHSTRIIGYTAQMVKNANPLKSLSQRDFRTRCGITDNNVIAIFRKLHTTLTRLHSLGIVVGDFNPLNVLVTNSAMEPHFIDCDSMQFGQFDCLTYTTRYVDPLNCALRTSNIELIKRHSESSDWYAFALLLWECLLFVHPYGGVYKQKAGTARIAPDARPLHRISLFHPDVQYPAAAQPMQSLPKLVLDFYQQLLEADSRQPFPEQLFDILEGLVITAKPSAGLVNNATVGTSPNARCRVLFHTEGAVLDVSALDGKVQFVYQENGAFKRENGSTIMGGQLSAALKFLIVGTDRTVAYKQQTAFILSPQSEPQRFPVESFRGGEPVMAANSKYLYFVRGGELWCQSRDGAVIHIDSVISNQTRIWSGENFGLGYFSAAGLRRVFVFNARAGKTSVELPDAGGFVSQAHCLMSAGTAWLFQSIKRATTTVHQCSVIDANGRLIGHVEIEDSHEDADWFASDHSKCVGTLQDSTSAMHHALFVATVEGVAQIELKNGQLEKTRIYQDVKDYVHPGDRLLFTDSGLVAWDSREIRIITSN